MDSSYPVRSVSKGPTSGAVSSSEGDNDLESSERAHGDLMVVASRNLPKNQKVVLDMSELDVIAEMVKQDNNPVSYGRQTSELCQIVPSGSRTEVASSHDEDHYSDSTMDPSEKPNVALAVADPEKLTGGHPREQKGICLFVFLTFFLIELVVNYDSGAIPAVLKELKDEFDMSDLEQGFLGALPYAGLVVASPFVGRMLQKMSPKKVLLITLFLNLLATILLAASYYSVMLLVSRGLIGLTQAAFVIYAPVWVDEFAPESKMTLWMALTQGGTVLGVMLGYLVAGFIRNGDRNWRWAITIQSCLLFLLVMMLLGTPVLYIDLYVEHHDSNVEDEECVDSQSKISDRHAEVLERRHQASIEDEVSSSIQRMLTAQALMTPQISMYQRGYVSSSLVLLGERESQRQAENLEVAQFVSSPAVTMGQNTANMRHASFRKSPLESIPPSASEDCETLEPRIRVISSSSKFQADTAASEPPDRKVRLERYHQSCPPPEAIGACSVPSTEGNMNLELRQSQHSPEFTPSPLFTIALAHSNTPVQSHIHSDSELLPQICVAEVPTVLHGSQPGSQSNNGRRMCGGIERPQSAFEVNQSFDVNRYVVTPSSERRRSFGAYDRRMANRYRRGNWIFCSTTKSASEIELGPRHDRQIPSTDFTFEGNSKGAAPHMLSLAGNSTGAPPHLSSNVSFDSQNSRDMSRSARGTQLHFHPLLVATPSSAALEAMTIAAAEDDPLELHSNTEAGNTGMVAVEGREVRSFSASGNIENEITRAVLRRRGSGNSIKRLISNSVYCWVTFTLCALFFVVTGIQFWSTRFFEEVMKIEYSVVLVAFSTSAATAPIIGVLAGGCMIDRLGGYKTKQGMFKTLATCTILASLATVCGIIAGFLEDFGGVIACIWFVLFFGAGILPPATGIVIAAVDSEIRAFASGFSMTMYSIFGYILACLLLAFIVFIGTLLPGALIQVIGMQNGMRLIFAWSFLGLLGIVMATIYAWRMKLAPEMNTTRVISFGHRTPEVYNIEVPSDGGAEDSITPGSSQSQSISLKKEHYKAPLLRS